MRFPFLTSNSFFLWLLAIAIPIVIHLLNRRRHRVVKWAAMAFLLKATRESRGKKKLKHIIILTCRALAIAALVMAVARPLASNFMGWGGGKLDTVILILDRSASMEQKLPGSAESKRENILKRLQASIKELGNPKLILIDSATGQPTSIPSPEVLDQISQTAATDTQANIPALIETAVNYLLEQSTGRTEIWVASDMQQADWQPESSRWNSIQAGLKNLTDQATLRVLAVKGEAENNTSINILSAQRVVDELVLEFELTRSYDGQAEQVPLTVSLNGAQREESLTLTGQSMRITKRLPLTDKSGYGYLRIPADDNRADNQAFFAYGSDIPANTAIVAARGEAVDYLSLATAPPGFGQSSATLYSTSQVNDIPWSNISLLVWQAPLPTEKDQKALLNFMDQGGVIVFYPPTEESENSFLDNRWGPISESPRGKFFIVPNWDQTDGPLKNGDEGTQVPVDKLKAFKRRAIVGDSSSLASWEDDSTFLSRSIFGKGQAYFVSTLPDYTWSNLADADVLLPIMQRLVQDGSDRFGSGFSAKVGSLLAKDETTGSQRRRLDNVAAYNPLNADYEAGVYMIGERLVATNRPAEEDLPELTSNEQLGDALEGTGYQLFENKGNSEGNFAQQLWQAFLVAMLLFLILEAILCLSPRRKQIEAIN